MLRAKPASKHASGIRVANSDQPLAPEAVREIHAALQDCIPQHIIVFFSLRYDARDLANAFEKYFPNVGISGCSTAGESAPNNTLNQGMVVIAFPQNGFRIASQTIKNLDIASIDQASRAARQLKTQLGLPPMTTDSSDNLFGLLLVDGLSNVEEQIVASINWDFGDIQLIGGSAGDNLSFDDTVLIANGGVYKNAAILILVETDVPFQVFKTQNFDPTETKLVVTAADPEHRIVHELNTEPAAKEYANAIGLMSDDLGPFSFASYPLVVKVGGDYYCRSIRNMNEDGSLSFFCAIDEGLVFTVARPNDILQSTRETLQNIDDKLGGIDMVIGFECILRRLDAESRQVRSELAKIYREFGVVGFHTYGEQFNAMHLNQTLTGIAFGARPESAIESTAEVENQRTTA